jgi:Toastrack DUF4097
MKNFLAAMAVLAGAMALAAIPVWGAEATFDRTLTVNGTVDLTVATGAGSIQITQGAANRVHIFGRVRSSWGANEARVREIAAHPPIEQTGNIVRIGRQNQDLRNISISYEIEAPAGAYLEATSGSGSVTDDGVGVRARLHTGSGSIHATGLQSGFSLSTGSGSIDAEGSGIGDVTARTGSGTIDLRGVNGALQAHTGSGSIKVQGKPAGPWRLDTGSGSVELSTGDAGFTLDAGTGSGGIHVDRPMTVQGSLGRHHVTGKVGGGGPTVRIRTGSGGIRVR